MTEDTLYWLFSTIAQTLGAIVGIIGMLTVYKLQLIGSQISQRMEASIEYRGPLFTNAFSQTPEEFVKEWPNLYGPDDAMSDPRERLDMVAIALAALLAGREKIRFRFLLFLIPNLSFIVLSIMGLLYPQLLTVWSTSIAIGTAGAMSFTFCSTIFLCSSLVKS